VPPPVPTTNQKWGGGTCPSVPYGVGAYARVATPAIPHKFNSSVTWKLEHFRFYYVNARIIELLYNQYVMCVEFFGSKSLCGVSISAVLHWKRPFTSFTIMHYLALFNFVWLSIGKSEGSPWIRSTSCDRRCKNGTVFQLLQQVLSREVSQVKMETGWVMEMKQTGRSS